MSGRKKAWQDTKSASLTDIRTMTGVELSIRESKRM